MRESIAARFDRVRAHPRYAVVMARTVMLPPTLRPGFALAWFIVALALLIVSATLLFAFVPFGPIFVGAMGLLATERYRHFRTAVVESRAPVEPSIRLVAQVRLDPKPPRWPRRRRTLVTLRGQYVPSLETVLDDSLADRVAHDDIGIAFIRRGRLVDFVRFDA